MSVRDHHNPYLRQRKQQDRENRAEARAKKRTRDFHSVRARLARDLLSLIND